MTAQPLLFIASWVWLAIVAISHNSTALVVSQIFMAAWLATRAILDGKSNG